MHIWEILLWAYKRKCLIKEKHRRLEEMIHVHAEVGKNTKNVVENKKEKLFYTLSVLPLCTIINFIREA
jgi:hypothetical protein